MAFASGTASDYLDLLAKFNTFVTGLSGGAAWTALRNTSTEKIWSAPGGGSDQILVGVKTFFNAGADYYNWRLGGFLAFDSGLAFEQQSGYVGIFSSTPTPSPVFTLWNSSIPYWFFATGRRAIIVAKVSTVYVSCYLGFLATYVSPGAWPYPLAVGGNLAFAAEPGATSPNWRWSYAGAEMTAFPHPRSTINVWDGSLRIRMPNGVWIGGADDTFIVRSNFFHAWPQCNWGRSATPDWRTNLDGGYHLLPIVLQDSTPNVLGELDGIFAVTGFSNGAENEVTVGGDTYLVVQNVFRTDQADYFAVKEA